MALVRGHSYRFKRKEVSVGDFCIDKWEYPNTQGAYPMVFISFQKAEDYCRVAGKRLCSELQWDYACTGGRDIGYPYGSDYSKKRCNTEGDTLFPIGTNLACVSLHGAYDLSGNAYEWVADDVTEEGNIAFSSRQVRGGNWYLGEEHAKCDKKSQQNGEYATRHTGFRCCYNF